MPEPSKEDLDKICDALAAGRVEFAEDISDDDLPDGSPRPEFEPRILSVRSGTKAFIIRWASKGIGVGELTIINDNGKVRMETEAMGSVSVKKILAALVESAELSD